MVGHVVYHKAKFIHIIPEREAAGTVGQGNIHKNGIHALQHHVRTLNRHIVSIDYAAAYCLRMQHIQCTEEQSKRQ
jgi:hypothetical protein